MSWWGVAVRAAARRTLAARGDLVATAFYYLLLTGVLGSLWRAAAQASGGTLAGYSADALFWYVAGSEAAVVPLRPRLIDDLGEDIAGGAVAVELLRPVPVLGLRVATELGLALPRLAVCTVAGIGLGLLVTGGPPAGSEALALPALVLAVACNVVAQHAFAGVSFWLRDTRSTWFLYQKLVFLLGGMIIPLEVLPGWLAAAVRFLPFPAMAYAPARLLSGTPDLWLLAVQLGWLAVLGAAAAAVFTRGERRLQVVGG